MESRLVNLSTISRVRQCAERTLCRVTLGDLFHYQGRMNRMDSEPPSFIKLASFLQEEMPVRFAHQLMEYYRLPFLIWRCEPFVTVHDAHLRAFEALSDFPKIETEAAVMEFTKELRHHLTDTDSIGSFRSGLGELKRHGFSRADLEPLHPFLDSFIVTRIGNQVLANHFLDWYDREQFAPTSNENVITECLLTPLLIPCINQVCNLAKQLYGLRPVVTIDNSLDAKVLVVPSHVQFIFREILKNAVHATMKKYEASSDAIPPPVQVTIRPGKFDVDLRVSDQGGGLKRSTLRRIWDYGYSGGPSPWPPMAAALSVAARDPVASAASDGATESSAKMNLQMSGYGMGVPLCKHYAKFFGGDLNFTSVYGFGTDVSIRLNRLLSIEERQEADMDSISGPAVTPPRKAPGITGERLHPVPSIFDFELGSDNDP